MGTDTHTDKILSSTKMTIVSPPILFGMTYNFQVAKFGNRQVIDCTERKIVFSEPYAACKPLKTFGQNDRYKDKLVFFREVYACFPTKARELKKTAVQLL